MSLCELRAVDADFGLSGVIRTATSVMLCRRHYGPGTFEIHVPDQLGRASSPCGEDDRHKRRS